MKEQIAKKIEDAIQDCKSEALHQIGVVSSVAIVSSLGIKPYKDGDQWCVRWGENIQEGICGFGATPMDAIIDFNYQLNH